MSRSTYLAVERYVGAGNVASYNFAFKIEALSQLLVVVTNAADVEQFRVRGTDVVFLQSVTFDPKLGGGTVILPAFLPSGYNIALFLANDAPTQPTEFKDKRSFTLERIEYALDFLAGAIQRLAFLGNRSIRLNDMYTGAFDPQLPKVLEADRVLMFGPMGASLVQGPTPAELAAAAQAAVDVEEALDLAEQYAGNAEAAKIAAEAARDAAVLARIGAEAAQAAAEAVAIPGGLTGSVLAKVSATDYDTEWKQYAYSGYSARFGANFSSTDLDDTIAKILNLQYAGPLVSLTAAGQGTIREKGTAVTAVALSAATTKRTNNIASVVFKKDGVTINTVAVPNPAGGTENYNWTGSFSDNATFSAEATDSAGGGGPTTATDSKTFQFVYPYYVGAGAAAMTAANVALQTKLLILSTATVVRSITATNGQVFYFAYPTSYGALTSILDVNNFETIGDWLLRTENITGLDGNAISYRIYEFKNPVVAGSYQFTFKR